MQEHVMGRAWLSMLRGQVGQLDDPQLKNFVEHSVYKLAETSQVQDRRLESVLIDSAQLNAFAAPGGIIGVNGGPAPVCPDRSRVRLGLWPTNCVLVATPLRPWRRGSAAYAVAHDGCPARRHHCCRRRGRRCWHGRDCLDPGGGHAGASALLPANEQEADRIGILNLEKAGYDPPRHAEHARTPGCARYRYDRKPPEFLLSHPVSESRIADTRCCSRARRGQP